MQIQDEDSQNNNETAELAGVSRGLFQAYSQQRRTQRYFAICAFVCGISIILIFAGLALVDEYLGNRCTRHPDEQLCDDRFMVWTAVVGAAAIMICFTGFVGFAIAACLLSDSRVSVLRAVLGGFGVAVLVTIWPITLAFAIPALAVFGCYAGLGDAGVAYSAV